MPIVAVGMVYSGVAAGGFAMTWAGLAAGAQIVGGVVSLVGTLTGDKKMENAGMMLGAAGSLGRAFVGSAGSTSAAAGSTGVKIGEGNVITSGQTVGQAADAGQAASADIMAINSKLAAMEKAQKMNLFGNVAQGVSTAYTGYQANKQAEDQFNQRRQDEKALIDERRRNLDLTKVKINIPVAPQRQGLLNAPQIDRSRIAVPTIKG